jgi:integrase
MFTPQQAKDIIDAAETPWNGMFGLAAYCGLRAGEILGLSVEDVNLENAVLTITKTAWQGNLQTAKSQGSETTVPMPAALCQLLKPLMPKSGLLFVNKARRPYTSTKIVERRLWPVCDSLGIPRIAFACSGVRSSLAASLSFLEAPGA